MSKITTRITVLYCLAWIGSGATANTWAQNAVSNKQEAPLFEVVSIKEHSGYSGPWALSSNWTPDSYVAEGIPLTLLINKAYAVRPDRVIGGPKWMNVKTFDINAKIASTDVDNLSRLSVPEKNAMLQQVLKSRFNLKVHAETKIMPVYQLVLAKDFSKKGNGLQRSTDTPAEQTAKHRMIVSKRHIHATDVHIADLASALMGILNEPVTDSTGMDDVFNFDLQWTPEDEVPTTAADQAPDIFTAVNEQLGLQLHATKGPVDFIAVDSASIPSAN